MGHRGRGVRGSAIAWMIAGVFFIVLATAPARMALAQNGEIAPFAMRQPPPPTDAAIDTALIIAVDVSQSVDEASYKLQMEGIALALEDPEVHAAIASARTQSILFALIGWADFPRMLVPWTIISSAGEAVRTAARIRRLPPEMGEFTCLAKLMQNLSDRLIPDMPLTVKRIIIDVSGDGPDNCAPPDSLAAERDRLVSAGATINGNPIVIAGVNDTDVMAGAYRAPGYGLRPMPWQTGDEKVPIDLWYQRHVMGGPGSFTLPAYGYEDFANAIKRKFVMEISALEPDKAFGAADPVGRRPLVQAR